MRASSERGSILILTALVMICLLGVLALAIDGSFMYTERNRMGAAADEAAKSAAWEVFLNNTTQNYLEAHADHEVQAHGFFPKRLGGDTDVIVNRPPTTGAHTTENTYVEVYVSRPTSTFFGTILGWTSLTPKARAVAGQSSSSFCLITLGDSPSGISIGTSKLQMPNCAIADAGDLVSTNPGGQSFIYSNGTAVGDDACQGNCANMGTVYYNAPPPDDPLLGKLAPVTHGACGPAPATGVIPSGVCYSSLDVTVDRTIAPGTVYFNGPITFNSGRHLTALGVTMVLDTGASLTGNQNTRLEISAPTSGTYPGIALYEVAGNTNTIYFPNSAEFRLTGAVYAPDASLEVRNGLDTSSDCVLFVVKSLVIDNGDGYLNNACASYAGSPLMTVSIAE